LTTAFPIGVHPVCISTARCTSATGRAWHVPCSPQSAWNVSGRNRSTDRRPPAPLRALKRHFIDLPLFRREKSVADRGRSFNCSTHCNTSARRPSLPRASGSDTSDTFRLIARGPAIVSAFSVDGDDGRGALLMIHFQLEGERGGFAKYGVFRYPSPLHDSPLRFGPHTSTDDPPIWTCDSLTGCGENASPKLTGV